MKNVDRVSNPQMTDDFARVYEETAHRTTGPIALAALAAAGPIGSKTRLLDIAAGAGALSVPAARMGASVLAVDVAPGMVGRLQGRLSSFERCEAKIMNGQELELSNDMFDATFSVFGVMTFTNWKKGLAEQARVTKRDGKGCVVTWRKPPGAGPFQLLFAALAKVFPDRPIPPWPEGLAALSDPERLSDEIVGAGFLNVSVQVIEAVWEGPAGDAYIEELRELHSYVKPYAGLDQGERDQVDAELRVMTTQLVVRDQVRLTSEVLLAVATGTRPIGMERPGRDESRNHRSERA